VTPAVWYATINPGTQATLGFFGSSSGPVFQGPTGFTANGAPSLSDLALVLRELRRRHARLNGTPELTYRELAARTGWSHGIIGEYLAGRVLPPTDRFDALTRLLGATPQEQGALAIARDMVEESRRSTPTMLMAVVPRQLPAEAFGFSGRREQVDELDGLLEQGTPGRAVVISAVSGTAGVGKPDTELLYISGWPARLQSCITHRVVRAIPAPQFKMARASRDIVSRHRADRHGDRRACQGTQYFRHYQR